MRMIKSVALALLQSIAIFLFAQQPDILITLGSSTHIQYPYSNVIKLPNGDLQFYDINVGVGNIQVTGFQYQLQTNTLTDLSQIGTITGFQGVCHLDLQTQRFGKLYSVYQYPDSYDPQGLILVRLDADDLTFRIINDLELSPGSSLFHTEIVAEDAFVFALEDSLVYYDFLSDTTRSLLDGDAYQCTPEQDKRLYAMPDGHFMYIKDSMMGYNTVPETWVVFDSQGDYQFTHTISDPWFGVSTIGISFSQNYCFVGDRFYIPNPGIDNSEACLECHFPTSDSLHYQVISPPGSLNEGNPRFIQFGADRILRSYYDYMEENTYLYMNFRPLEFNPEPTHWNNIGPTRPNLDNINEFIVTYTSRMENQILINALCTLDFPTPHSFSFAAPQTNVYLPTYTYPYSDKLLLISDNILYPFDIDFSVSNDDSAIITPINTISAYPNPVSIRDVITFKVSADKPIDLDIYNIRGQRVDTIILDSEGTAKWNLRTHDGAALPSGVYIAVPRKQKGIKPLRFIALQ